MSFPAGVRARTARGALALGCTLAATATIPVAAGATTFTVTSNADSGAGSLRQALLDANAGGDADDVIAFDLADPTIAVASDLPAITAPVLIDGLTQDGAEAPSSVEEFDAVLPVSLTGTAGTGLQTAAGTTGIVTIRGLRISGFATGVASLAPLLAVRLVASEVTDADTGVVLERAATTPDVVGGEAVADTSRVADSGTGVRLADAGAFVSPRVVGSFIQQNDVGVEVATGGSVTGNLIGSAGGDQGTGVLVTGGPGVSVTDNAVVENTVGIDLGRASVVGRNLIVGNRSHGIAARDGMFGAFGQLVVENEVIANGGAGVAVLGGLGTQVLGNAIVGNGGLGIDLGADGPTPNDPLDADHLGAGGVALPNSLQNAPVVERATTADGATTVVVHVDTMPTVGTQIEIFRSPSCDPSGYGEGAEPLGRKYAQAGPGGRAAAGFVLPSLPHGTAVTATATTAYGTSEFSPCSPSGPPPQQALGGGGQSPVDRAAPRITGLRLDPPRFAVATAPSRSSVVRGSTVRFRLSEAAQVELRISRRVAGRSVGGRCRRVTRRNRGRRRCVRTVVAGRLNHAGTAGANRVPFTGRIAGRALPRGSYQLTARAVDVARNAATPRTARFRIVGGSARR